MESERFRRMFPNLAKEMDSDENKVPVNSIRSDPKIGEASASSREPCRYSPDVIDFLRRCDTAEQAEEIIVYMERRREIEKSYAQKLRRQLKQKGVRSFGSRKEENYYLNHGEV